MTETLTKARDVDQRAAQSFDGGGSDWREVTDRLLAAVEPRQREDVARVLEDTHGGGWGLRLWVSSIIWGGASLPEQVPAELIDVYLTDPEAMPLHECGECGLPVPVRPNRVHGNDGDPERVYFPACPACDSPTGWYLFRAK